MNLAAMREANIRKATRIARVLEGSNNLRILDSIIEKSEEEATPVDFEAIPLEQLRGDIARAGHPIKQLTALDPEGRRLFFTDKHDQHLFAEFATEKDGHRVTRIGHQANIAKEYVDVVDLEPSSEDSNHGETVTTVHEEDDSEKDKDPADLAGMYPGPTHGDKPETDDRGFGKDEQMPSRVALLSELRKLNQESK